MPLARAKRSRRYQRSFIPPRMCRTPEQRRARSTNAMNRIGSRAKSAAEAPSPVATAAAIEANTENSTHGEREHDEGDDEHDERSCSRRTAGIRPSRAPLARTRSRRAGRPAPSAREDRTDGCRRRGAAHRFTSSASQLRSAPSRIGSASSRGSAHSARMSSGVPPTMVES